MHYICLSLIAFFFFICQVFSMEVNEEVVKKYRASETSTSKLSEISTSKNIKNPKKDSHRRTLFMERTLSQLLFNKRHRSHSTPTTDRKDLEKSLTELTSPAHSDLYTILNLILEDKNLNINIQDNNLNTPLHYAVSFNNITITELLLQRPDINPMIENITKQTPKALITRTTAARIRGQIFARVSLYIIVRESVLSAEQNTLDDKIEYIKDRIDKNESEKNQAVPLPIECLVPNYARKNDFLKQMYNAIKTNLEL